MLLDSFEASAADQSLKDAVAAYRTGKFSEVEALCKQTLAQQPEHIGSLQLLAAVLGQRGEPRRGIELLEKAISFHPDSADNHIQLAKLLRLENRNSDAVAELTTAIEIQPESAAAYNDLGLIYLAEAEVAKAIDCYNRAIDINPNLTVAHFNKGVALERQGACSEAIASFRRAIALDSNFAEAHAELGNLLLFEGDRVGAFECFRSVAAAKPGSALALTSEAKILVEQDKPSEAHELVKRAIDLQPRNSYIHCLSGTILMQLGKFHDAATAFDEAMVFNHGQIAAYHGLAQIKKLTASDRPLLARMEWMLGEYDLAEDEQSELHFALGKGYDNLGEYGKAIEHYDQGNCIKHRDTSFDHAGHELVADRVIARFTADFFALNAASGSSWEVPILIFGMPRYGTTLVEQIISSHPEVAAGGELAYWSRTTASFRGNAAGAIDPAWVDEVVRDYRTLLANVSPTARRVTDKSLNNFLFMGLIHAALPRARLIHCRRHPVDTCLSIYFQSFARRMDFAYDRSDLVCAYRQYLKLMAHWRSVLPKDRFLEIQYEELVADREAMTRKIIDFCGLEWNDACLHSERNPRSVQTASVWQARQPVYRTSVARWRRYEKWLGVLRDLLPENS